MAAETPVGGPWDWIFSSSMLQWASDPAATFSAWRACLAPEGRVIAGLFAAESLPEWAAIAGEKPPVTWRTPQEWRLLLSRSGLRLVRDQSQRREFVYPSAHAFLRSLHGVGGAPARRIPPARLRKLIGDYGALHGVAGGVSATWTFYRFEAAR